MKNSFSYSITFVNASSTRLECVLKTYNSNTAKYIKEQLRKDLLSKSEGYATTHFYCQDEMFNITNMGKTIKENFLLFVNQIQNIQYGENENVCVQLDLNHSENHPTFYIAYGLFQSQFPKQIYAKDLQLLEYHQDTKNEESSFCLDSSRIVCWTPHFKVCEYDGHNKELLILLIIQKGSLNHYPVSCVEQLHFLKTHLFDSQYKKSNLSSILETKLQLDSIDYSYLNLCPFQNVSIVPTYRDFPFGCNQKDLHASFYCSIHSKYPMDILKKLKYFLDQNNYSEIND